MVIISDGEPIHGGANLLINLQIFSVDTEKMSIYQFILVNVLNPINDR